ncbi:MAG: efflux RND transporter periplasmic adaptor subunit [Proteobacteria bacterium]|nr:efflux RND transporter periplasmic adaptor subunit [Pseudomonadota bacterium]
MEAVRWTAAIAVALLSSSCDEKAVEPPNKAPPSLAADGAFCEEHGVLEAVCTKCNPKLVPVFKAKGDWCEEHRFPESFCPVCHPELGGKPAVDVAGADAPADGTKVRFRTKEAATLAGIATVPAKKRPGGAQLEAVATVLYDATLHAEVNARAPGVVRKLHADIGAVVKVGEPLATIESAAVGADRALLGATATRVEVALAEYNREKSLRDKGIASDKEVLAAKREWEDAKAAHAAARATLGMVGTGGGHAGRYVLRAPLDGTVTERKATIGHMVDLDHLLFEIVDTRTMWVEIDLPENRLSFVRVGQNASIRLDAIPEREWRGTIQYIAPAVDPRTRTAKARVALNNPNGLLRKNMYGRALIELAEAKPMVMVPREAVQRAGNATLVFVRLTEDVFEARRVRVGLTEGAFVELLAGVAPGEPVATTGSFLLKTETLKGSIGAGCCDVE